MDVQVRVQVEMTPLQRILEVDKGQCTTSAADQASTRRLETSLNSGEFIRSRPVTT